MGLGIQTNGATLHWFLVAMIREKLASLGEEGVCLESCDGAMCLAMPWPDSFAPGGARQTNPRSPAQPQQLVLPPPPRPRGSCRATLLCPTLFHLPVESILNHPSL